jgi:hypothetical protein
VRLAANSVVAAGAWVFAAAGETEKAAGRVIAIMSALSVSRSRRARLLVG